MKKVYLKALLLILIWSLPFFSLSNAQLLDKEDSDKNYFQAAIFDLKINSQNLLRSSGILFDSRKIKSSESIEKSIRLENGGNMPLSYYPYFIYKEGDINLCKALRLTMYVDSSTFYEGLLSDLGKSPLVISLSGSDDLIKFQIKSEISDTVYQGKHCKFDFEFRTYRDESSQNGFYDKEVLSNFIKTAYEPSLDAMYDPLKHQFVFTFSNLKHFKSFDYILSYKSDTISDLVKGSEDVKGSESITTKILTGSCSEYGTCVYHPNPRDFKLEIKFIDIDGNTLVYTLGV